MPPRPNKYDLQHRRNMRRYQKQIDAIYQAAVQEAAAIGCLVGDFDPSKPFSFADYPITHDRVRRLMATLASEMQTCVVNGVTSEWTLANNKNNYLCDLVFGENKLSLPYEAARRYYATNHDALQAFLTRQENGLNLSDRVWRYTDAFKNEIEAGLDLGIRSGRDARSMAKDLQTYLRHPDKLFRRVRDEHGELQLSKAAAAFHPGRGVYRSSYKNALRLAGTETNIAYRTADHVRWADMEFVVGQEVCCSDTNHPTPDICDELEGKYPKDFKFVGWHPHCRCYVIPVLKTEEEVDEDVQRILRGEEPLPPSESENVVEAVPDGFNTWIEDNSERTARARQLPYFIADNPQYVNLGIETLTAHKTGAHMFGRDSDREFKTMLKDPAFNAPATLTAKVEEDTRLLCEELGIQRTEMTWSEADGNMPNLDGFRDNCQSAVLVYEARRRGIDIVTLAYSGNPQSPSFRLGENSGLGFVGADGNPLATRKLPKDKKRMEAELRKATAKEGRYHLGMDFNAHSGHIIVAERVSGRGVVFYDPSDGSTWSLGEIVARSQSVELLRVDNKPFNHAILKGISRTR